MSSILRVSTLILFIPMLVVAADGKFSETEKENEFKKAETYFFTKQFQSARSLLLKIIRKRPEHFQAISLLGDTYLFQKRYKQAIFQYQKAVILSPRPAIEYFRLGQAYLELGQGQISKGFFQKAHTKQPNIKRALFQIGYIALFFERDKVQTIRYWKQFIREAPDDPQYKKIKKAIALLEDPDFKIPEEGSEIPLKEALLVGSIDLQAESVEVKHETGGDATSKTSNQTKELLEDEKL